jgi:zinc protease
VKLVVYNKNNMQQKVKNKNFDFVKSSGGISEYKLNSNDLTVLLKDEKDIPVVCIMVTYLVGSRNEALGYTGATHMLEHLLFKGSKNFNKKKGNQADVVLISKGALTNASTWFDRTNYYEVLPSEYLDTALAIEADRMRGAYLRESDRASEMSVVRSEFEMWENHSMEALDKSIWASAFMAHPYHHPTIGWRSDIENVSIERLKQFYDTFYWPNNATLSVIGRFDSEKILDHIYKYFGKIPRSKRDIPIVYTTEPVQQGQRHTEVTRVGESRLFGVAHKAPPALHQDTYVLELLMNILVHGRASRLYRALVDKGLAISVESFFQPLYDAGLFIVYVNMAPLADWQQVEKIILNEYELIKKRGISEQELKRAKAQILVNTALIRDGVYTEASALNEAIAVGDWTFYTTFNDRINAVNSMSIKEVAQKYFIHDHSTVGRFIPKNSVGNKK